MAVSAFVVTAFLETLSPGPRMLACVFPAAADDRPPISLEVEARPSLMDRVDRFRVRLLLGGEREVGGLAQPIDRTAERDVLIRGRAVDDTFYTIGLRDDGHAALNLLHVDPVSERTETRQGECRGFKGALDTWLRFDRAAHARDAGR